MVTGVRRVTRAELVAMLEHERASRLAVEADRDVAVELMAKEHATSVAAQARATAAERDAGEWHRTVVECERILALEGTADSGLTSNLPNAVRDLVVRTEKAEERWTRKLYFNGRGKWYAARCPLCGWRGSSEQCRSDGESCECPTCGHETEDDPNVEEVE
jgi:hypothetical protein